MNVSSIPSFGLRGKKAIVTGGSKGIGLTIATGLAHYGAEVMVTGRNEEALKDAVRNLKEHGYDVKWKRADVTSKEEVEELFSYADEVFGQLDILINNAGMNIRKPLVEVEEEDWDQVLNTNLKGIFLVGQQAAKRMINQQSGRIINISSILGQVGNPLQTSYAASKGGINQLTKVWAAELADHHITVNAIAPAYIKTPMTEGFLQDPERVEQILSRTLLKRMGEVEEVIGPAIFFASDASSYVTGQVLYVDGGWTAN
ncbi:SDR family NAD(P)-dependent oxidoreductase [Planococcus lenghuensis]|uniref:2-deoxy-D-gluconate 3-dehydrogenase n=1 Tax=Planococcus lenghuensis TaxID=2213202 RepID=A0A1Q2L2X3_9BACL|nr:glucose 1-dehydrogenase [Planococcus lenghuensis]AQQ54714.1 2-deoxy-D-gluconate 3-dehydrogenase [Planococcus lenghuensis]